SAAGASAPALEPPRHDETATLRASLEEHQKALEAWKQAHAQLEERLAQAQQAAPVEDDSRVTELEAERDALESELAEAQKPATPDPQLNELIADRENLQAELTARDTSIAELTASRATVESARAELEQALAREVERVAAVCAELEERKAAPAP